MAGALCSKLERCIDECGWDRDFKELDEFFTAQKGFLGTGRAIKEELENVRYERQGRLASVWADFVLTDEGKERHGKLILLLIEDRGQFKISGIVFSYHG